MKTVSETALFTVVQDNDAHKYVIPFEKLHDWYTWLDIPEDDERSWERPEYSVMIDGGHIVFDGYGVLNTYTGGEVNLYTL